MAISLKLVTGIIDKVVDKILPDPAVKNKHKEKIEALALSTYEELVETESKVIQDSRAFDIKELGLLPDSVRIIRGCVRPFITLIAVSIWIANCTGLIVLATGDYAIVAGVFTYYFGTRSWEKKNGISGRF